VLGGLKQGFIVIVIYWPDAINGLDANGIIKLSIYSPVVSTLNTEVPNDIGEGLKDPVVP
jgi:hypothetical protein